ncbi:BspA family leucine-rich repeat surface protein [Thioalkalivibrio sp. ALE16]|uniref:BspA family leucine-rich repeat surface protein n=1 Tax=Thioalkalivibrio sp. ALE16 TaxID=1158172 RepID=UPI0003606432|nr:BspA family leucine-rich repeat surface protein [Thioalkalivibrio sp. ALE16]
MRTQPLALTAALGLLLTGLAAPVAAETAPAYKIVLPSTQGVVSAASASDEPESAAEDCYDPENVGKVGQWSGCDGMLIVSTQQLRDAAPFTGDGSLKIGDYTFKDDDKNIFTGQVTDLSSLFLNSDFNDDIGYWDVSNATTMLNLFRGTTQFNQYIGEWDTGNVEDMRAVFLGAEEFNQDIGGWDTGKMRRAWRMLSNTNKFNQNIGGWDTSNLDSASGIFMNTKAFNQDIGGWDTSNNRHFRDMFRNAESFDQDLSGWSVEKMENNENFAQGSPLEGERCPVETWPGC